MDLRQRYQHLQSVTTFHKTNARSPHQRRFPQLQEIAKEIPLLDSTAGIHLLIGRDSPELHKVREFKNGPKGALQALRLKVTISACELVLCPNKFTTKGSLTQTILDNNVFSTSTRQSSGPVLGGKKISRNHGRRSPQKR